MARLVVFGWSLVAVFASVSAVAASPTIVAAAEATPHTLAAGVLAAATLVALVLLVALCAGLFSSHAPPPTTPGVTSPPPDFGMPVATTRGAVQSSSMYEAVDQEDEVLPSVYGTPVSHSQAAQDNEQMPFFQRVTSADGRLTYKGVSLTDAEIIMMQGGQVFKRPDKQQPGQDIYEALPSSNDLYAQVSKHSSSSVAADVYAMPTKKRNAGATAAAVPPAAPVLNEIAYSAPVILPETAVTQQRPAAALPPQETYAVPDQKLLAGERPLPDKKGYVNDQVVQQHMMAKMVEAQKKAVGASANGAAHTYVPLQEQGAPPVSTQGLYEAVDDGENAAEIEIVQPPSRPADPELHGDDAVRAWLGCALTRDEAQRLLLGKPAGLYLVRKSPNSGTPVISLSWFEAGQARVANFKVLQDERNMFFIYVDKGDPIKFPSLFAMLQYYRTHDTETTGGLPHQLLRCLPFTRAKLGR